MVQFFLTRPGRLIRTMVPQLLSATGSGWSVTKTTTDRVAQNFVFPETTHLVISPVMKMGTKCVWLAGEENIVKQVGGGLVSSVARKNIYD